MSALDQILSQLTYGFVQRAFLIGILVALLSSLLSVFIVLKNVSLIGDGLAHTAFGGLAVGYYVGFFPLWTAAGLVVLGAMGITKLTRSTKIPSDAAVAVFLTLGLASGILLYELGRGFGISLESLLFGSILLASTNQFLFVAAVLAAVLARPDWPEALFATLVPSLRWDAVYVATLVGVLGTTISGPRSSTTCSAPWPAWPSSSRSPLPASCSSPPSSSFRG